MRLIFPLIVILLLSILNFTGLFIPDLSHSFIVVIVALEIVVSIIAVYSVYSFQGFIKTMITQLSSGKPETNSSQYFPDLSLQQLFTLCATIQSQCIELEKFKEQYEPVIKESDDGYWNIDIESGKIYISNKMKEMLGYNELELQDNLDAITGIIYEDDLSMVRDTAINYVKNGQTRFTIEYRMKHKNGSLRWFVSNVIIIRDTNGKACRIAGTNSNITKYKLLEQRLRGSEEQTKI